MMARRRLPTPVVIAAVLATLLPLAGCQTTRLNRPAGIDAPRELAKAPTPPYVVEPPDILIIDAIRVIPLPPYRVEPLDALFISATNTLPTDPISGVYSVEPDGTVNLGGPYGSVRVADLTLDEARAAIEARLKNALKETQVTVSLAQSRATQQIRGEHLVGPDGTVNLGVYGSCYVAGKTVAEVKLAIEAHLSQYLYKPEVSVDVFAFNSKVYYVITDGGGFGEPVARVPLTGNETVLDAISQINGLPVVASKKGVWIARPSHGGNCVDHILPVDWNGITRCGRADTNYQLMAGDRVYVMAQPLVTVDTVLSRIIAPVERVFSVILLGNSTVQTFGRNNFNNALLFQATPVVTP